MMDGVAVLLDEAAENAENDTPQGRKEGRVPH